MNNTTPESEVSKENGSGGDVLPELKRKAFKAGEKERHFALLGKTMMRQRSLKADLKKTSDKVELILDDIEKGGYALNAQGELAIDVEDADEARA